MAKRSIGLAAGYALSLVGSVFSLVLYAQILGPADYGRLAVDLALVEALQGVLFQWHRLAVVRFWAANEKTGFESYLATCHLSWLALACVAIAAGGATLIAAGKPLDVEWLAVIAMGLGKSAALYAQEIARVSGAVVRYALGALCLTIGSAVAGIAAYELTHSITAVLIASTAAFALSSVVFGWRTGKFVTGGRFSARHLRPMLHYGLPLIPVFVATTALTRLDRPVLALFEAPEVVGIYAAAAALVANIISAASLLVVTPAYPWLLREKERRTADDYQRMHVQIGVLMLAGVLATGTALYCARATVLPGLLGGAIGNAAQAYVLPLLAIAFLSVFRAHFFDQAYHLFARTRALMAINLATLAVALAALYLGARWGGVDGLLCGLLIVNALALVASATFSRSFVNLRLLSGNLGVLVLVSAVAGLTGDLAARFWLPAVLDGPLIDLASAGIALVVFTVAMVSANVGAIRSPAWRRS